ncbi:cell division protein ZipA C-terminal FtsZ-binding domain-containing protein [Thiomicrorhabdus aquaedulcis]|uniref:cell division protein ZipA C-terminal FtsZ-binding domain-containing protein n=1 Tax=Thiomicrorhabdus aquaedulcis TaxID=2211106 RepID=UPI000FDC4BC7|nr:cell division protein ZipA C-terminal FtsZ-binding domain-containing protein [Thiomicrorhabdus aquaedulcis]
MNELQQVLLIFSIVVIAGLYFLSKSRQKSASSSPSKTAVSSGSVNSLNKSTAEEPSNASAEPTIKRSAFSGLIDLLSKKTPDSSGVNDVTPQSVQASHASKQLASNALNQLGEPHMPLSRATEERLHLSPEALPEINPNQLSLPLGEEFELPSAEFNPVNVQFLEQKTVVEHTPTLTTLHSSAIDSNVTLNPSNNHYVLVVDDPGLNGTAAVQTVCESEKPSFGIPKDKEGRSPGVSSGVKKNHEVYVLLVLSGATDFAMPDVNQALLGAGLSFSPKLIYVKNDTMGGEIIRIANLLEPGTFPTENLAHFTTPGIAMILELPTTVRAPRAMDDLIMMGRKVSQRLNGRLYNMERQLIKESDLQAMREAAIAYESSPL